MQHVVFGVRLYSALLVRLLNLAEWPVQRRKELISVFIGLVTSAIIASLQLSKLRAPAVGGHFPEIHPFTAFGRALQTLGILTARATARFRV